MGKAQWLAASLLLPCVSALAMDYQWNDDVGITFKNRISMGAAWRMQNPSTNLLGKENVPGQENLCSADNCITLTGDPGPNLRLVKAPGSFFGGNGDNGDMNFKRYSIVAATTMWDSDLKFHYHDFLFRVRGIGFYDPANVRREDHHNNTLYQPAQTPQQGGVKGEYARNVRLMEAYGQYSFNVADHHGTFSVGQQSVRWGESTLVAVNSISEINPPNQVFLNMPGAQFNQIFQPVPLALLSFDVREGLTADLLYQFGWKPVQPNAEGSFLSTNDIAGGGQYATLALGQFPEDPNSQQKPAGILGLISSTSINTRILPQNFGYPKNGGQYGAKLGYSADWLNGGTELGFYFLNYHSRLPYAGAFAANDSCARNSPNAVQGTIDCRGFNGSLNVTGAGLEPAPFDTVKLFLDYPENIHMFGISFNTNIGPWAVSGEYSYRPNVPVQVQLNDVIFAAARPALPLASLSLPLGVTTIQLPSESEFLPSFLAKYRGIACGTAEACDVQHNQLIRGYERLHVGQFDLTGIKIFSDTQNPFGAQQIIWIAEVGFTQVYNLPSLDTLQFEGGTFQDTHRSRGGDGTGPAAPLNPDGTVQPDTSHFTPTYQSDGFATRFSWGVRSIIQMEYDNVMFGWSLKPQFLLLHDFHGIAPSPMQNFIQDTSQVVAGTDINFSQSLTGHVQYQWFFGGGRNNNLIDRANTSVNIAYSF
ncbi:MAG: DUF1302 domain-containing protein [Stenotrophobium sp.]